MPEFVTMDITKMPDAVRYYTVDVYDPKTEELIDSKQMTVERCWLFITTSGQKSFLPAGVAGKISELPEAEGEVVGYLVKINPSTGEIRYAHPTDEQH